MPDRDEDCEEWQTEEPFYRVAGGCGAVQFGGADQGPARASAEHVARHGARRCIMVLEDSPAPMVRGV